MARREIVALGLILIIILALAGVVSCGGSTNAAVSSDGSTFRDTITVSGEGKIYAPSDEATISLAVRTVKSTATEAMSANSAAIRKVIDALKAQGLSDDEVKTGNVSLYPQQDWREGRAPQIISYTAENRVVVRTQKLDKLGGVIDAATTAGANEVSELRFQLSEDNEVRQDALKIAVRNARNKATVLAKEAGVGVGKAVIINESSSAGPVIPYYEMRAESMLNESAAPPVMPQDIMVTGQVSVTFEMK